MRLENLALYCAGGLFFFVYDGVLFPHPLSLSKVIQVERERSVKWGKMIHEWGRFVGSPILNRRVNKGIPNSVRGAVWRHVLDIDSVRQDGIYEVSARLPWSVCCTSALGNSSFWRFVGQAGYTCSFVCLKVRN